jgi:hypothetical protein
MTALPRRSSRIRITKLLNLATSTDFGPERETALTPAQRLGVQAGIKTMSYLGAWVRLDWPLDPQVPWRPSSRSRPSAGRRSAARRRPRT